MKNLMPKLVSVISFLCATVMACKDRFDPAVFFACIGFGVLILAMLNDVIGEKIYYQNCTWLVGDQKVSEKSKTERIDTPKK